MRWLFGWLAEQRSGVVMGLAVVLFAVTLILRFGFNTWWPAGIALATVLAVIALIAGSSKSP